MSACRIHLFTGVALLSIACAPAPSDPMLSGPAGADPTSGEDTLLTSGAEDGGISGQEGGADPGTTGNNDASGESTAGSFLAAPDAGGMSLCDPWAQDCSDGEKCVAYRSPEGTTWDANRCVPVVPDPNAAGDTCIEFGGGQSGEDDCDATSVCNYVVEGEGICVAMCTGSADAPQCEDAQTSCNIDNDGTRILCNPTCDPILQDCPDNSRMTCLVANGADGFNCELGWGDGGVEVGDECVFDNACLNGNLCIFDPASVPGCNGVGCCTPYCDLDAPTCPDAATQCVPFYDVGTAPPGYGHVGVCLIPN